MLLGDNVDAENVPLQNYCDMFAEFVRLSLPLFERLERLVGDKVRTAALFY